MAVDLLKHGYVIRAVNNRKEERNTMKVSANRIQHIQQVVIEAIVFFSDIKRKKSLRNSVQKTRRSKNSRFR